MEKGDRTARPAPRRALLLCAALASLAALGLADGADRDGGIRVRGEYSLSVLREDGRLEVRWLTAGRTRGAFEARAGGRAVHADTTAEGTGHRVRFPVPEADRVLLRYGALGADSLHETALRPAASDAGRKAEAVLPAPDSLWVVGDVHGHYDRLRRLLEGAGLVDGSGRWAGGRSHLVLLGDLMDRGPHVTRTLWFAYRLQEEARAAGGRVHVALGNHEVMVLAGDHRYVSSRERLLARRLGLDYGEMYDRRRSVLGRWLASRPAALKVGRVLLAHGGLGPAYRGRGLRDLNDSVAAFLAEEGVETWTRLAVTRGDSGRIARRVRLLFDEQSPLWYRGYAAGEAPGETLRELLRRHDARLHVIAHTPVPSVRQSYGDSVALVDLERPASAILLLVPEGDGLRRRVYRADGKWTSPTTSSSSAQAVR